MKTNWKVQVNDGNVQDFETETSLYGLAALAALAQLKYDKSTLLLNDKSVDIVKIWSETLISDYGPYEYGFDGQTLYNVVKRGDDWTFISH